MPEESWHQARLIPVSGINGAQEQERRATSALLAVMTSVREFGRILTQPLGAPSGNVETYIEVPFQVDDRQQIPDGLIRVSRGQRSWTALVEVKTATNCLEAVQLESYLDIAKREGFNAVITISNEVPPVAGQHPTKVDKRKLTKVALHHYSWAEILSEAIMQKEHRGIADPDQAWILGELIRYLEHPKSGALEFDDMGQFWVPVRNAVAAGTLRATDKGVVEVAGRFDALLRYTGLRLGRQLGIEVVPMLPRRESADPARRTQELIAAMVNSGMLTGSMRIPYTVGLLVVTVDLRANKVMCHVDIDAPKEGRSTTRINWLIRQLRNAPESARIEAFAMHARGPGAAELLRTVREDPSKLIEDPKRELRMFRVASSATLGSKRGRDRGSFIKSVLDAVDAFYADVMQELRPWMAAPPRIRDLSDEPTIAPIALSSTALSSQDGSESSEEPEGTDAGQRDDQPENDVPAPTPSDMDDAQNQATDQSPTQLDEQEEIVAAPTWSSDDLAPRQGEPDALKQGH